MMHRATLPVLALMAATLVGVVPACSSDSSEGAGSPAGSGGAPGADASPESEAPGDDASADTGTGGTTQQDASPEGAADDDAHAPDSAAADAAFDHGPVTSCADLGSVECFANNECNTAQRCENAGTEVDPVPCCVVGARGTGAAGDLCTTENDCESGVCIAGTGPAVCSETCTTEADCPDGMKTCTYIAFSTSNDKWCLPPGH